MLLKNKMNKYQAGLSLVEIMVGLVIGLLATLVIMQVFSTFEGQKRTTTGNADAQTNGSIALFSIQRDVQMAGFGLPVFDTQNPPLKCEKIPTATTPPTVDHDSNLATAAIGMSPITITDGGGAAGASDSIAIRYSTDGATSKGGIVVKIIGPAPAAPEVGVDNNLGCNNGDVVLVSAGNVCAMTKVDDANLAADTTHITLKNSSGATIGASLSCIGQWNQFTYTVVNNQLQRNDASVVAAVPFVSEIVNMQAQYGVSTLATNNQITSWVDATTGGTWGAATMTIADRNRIKAVRIAVVARNGLLEKANVAGSTACSSLTAAAPTGICAWVGTATSPAPTIDLSNDGNWQKYRYRVYETIIPLRNMIWSKNTL
ncbi:MAG: prepilin-type cleavage/methylation domain-containing protein [Methylotenera sp.]|nr:prepilin-type cleavage/methylation domain-containing protein [Methylotenera sp.]